MDFCCLCHRKKIQDFPKSIQAQSPLKSNEEYVPYDVESFFTNVPVKETIEYMLDELYKKRQTPQNLHTPDPKTSSSEANNGEQNYYKQTDGCTMGISNFLKHLSHKVRKRQSYQSHQSSTSVLLMM